MKQVHCSFCSRCGRPLDIRTAMLLRDEESKGDFVMDWFAAEPGFKEFVRSRLKVLAIEMAAGQCQPMPGV